MKKPGSQIRRAREAKGLSQEELAEIVKISQQTIGKIEKDVILRSRFLPAIAKALEIPLGELDEAYSVGLSPEPANKSLAVHIALPGRGGSMLFSEEPLYYMHTPEPLFDLDTPFALIMGDNSMKDIVRSGDILLCGEYGKPDPDGPMSVLMGNRDGKLSNLRPLRVRRFVIPMDDNYVLERNDPPGMDIVPQSEWPEIFKVYGVLYK